MQAQQNNDNGNGGTAAASSATTTGSGTSTGADAQQPQTGAVVSGAVRPQGVLASGPATGSGTSTGADAQQPQTEAVVVRGQEVPPAGTGLDRAAVPIRGGSPAGRTSTESEQHTPEDARKIVKKAKAAAADIPRPPGAAAAGGTATRARPSSSRSLLPELQVPLPTPLVEQRLRARANECLMLDSWLAGLSDSRPDRRLCLGSAGERRGGCCPYKPSEHHPHVSSNRHN